MGDFDASAAEHGLTIDAVDWLPSGGRSGLVRVRGRRPDGDDAALPELVVEHAGEAHRHTSLPDPRAGRVPGAWRGAYVVHADLVDALDARLRLEFPGGVHIALPRPSSGASAAAAGAEVVDRAVLADRRARRAEAAEQAQARIAREALKAVEVLELRAAQLEDRLDAVTAERDALAAARAGEPPAFAPPNPEVPELRRRLADAEARVRELQARPLRVVGPADAADRRAERLREALTTAITTVGELRLQLHEARVRSRTAEIANAAEAVRLRVLASERAAMVAEMRSLREAVDEAAQLRTIQAAEIERISARVAGAEAAHEETRRRFAERVAELGEARGRIGELEAELAAVRAEIPERVRVAVQERTRELEQRRERAEREMAAREAQAQAAVDAARRELERAEAALAHAETERELAEAAATSAEMRLRSFEVARAAGVEQDLGPTPEVAGLRAELEAARAQIESQVAKLRTLETLESELEHARALLATQTEALDAARQRALGADDDAAVVAGLTAELGAAHETVRTLSAELDELRARTATLAEDLEAERARRPASPPVPEELPARAAAQEEAAAIAPATPAPDRLVADLAAAAEALRARTPEPADAAPDTAEPAGAAPESPEPAGAAPESREPAGAGPEPPEPAGAAPDSPAPAGAAPGAAEPAASPSTPASIAFSPPVAPGPPRREAEPEPQPQRGPQITSPAEPPPGRVATGRHARAYSPLRGALVKLAHDDPAAAARLLVGLLPAQWRVLEEPLEYDVTITEAGTYAVSVSAGAARVRPVTGARPEGEFHLRADALTLAEMLAGHGPKPRRFGSAAKVSGRARRVRALQPLAEATLSLPDAVRAGARLEPELVLRTLAYAVHPSWTAGHSFTIAHTFTGPDGDETLYIAVRDGRGLTISHDAPQQPVDTTVVLTRRAFDALLRGDAPPPGERPSTRGDHRAAQTLRAWADRARAGA